VSDGIITVRWTVQRSVRNNTLWALCKSAKDYAYILKERPAQNTPWEYYLLTDLESGYQPVTRETADYYLRNPEALIMEELL